ncbi:MAG: MBL fold metallo-hydrolase [Kiritimatiellales bacterium]|jgi:phosphoribosyl 1,2-cyclic phosphate phosphodiesterase
MKFTFLGTGTSHGIPMIGCHCTVCRSGNPKNKRRRCSLYVQAGGKHLLFDTPPDLRDQVLTFGVERVDAVFITHPHADHIFGFDDIRRFSDMQKEHIHVYGSPATIASMRTKFDYVDKPSHSFGGVPRVIFTETDAPVEAGGTRVTPVPVMHGEDRIYGYLVEADGKRLAYIPDCSGIPEERFHPPSPEGSGVTGLLENLDVMILDGLRPGKHATHFSIEESVEHLQRIGARRSFLTHLTHHSDHDALQASLPAGIEVPWDGLTVS